MAVLIALVTDEPLSDLPSAWRAAIRFCPYCAGLGYVMNDEASEVSCRPCEGTGSLFGSMLGEAFAQGRRSALRGLGEAGMVIEAEKARCVVPRFAGRLSVFNERRGE